ncbi:MAG: hypothetical protein CENE_02284 [Candidatus Celerinatantimonas neptuna]|nr:MAG: hypothetical protein CENE_02284 [Candidatus Celerinatantimonas neptuna]
MLKLSNEQFRMLTDFANHVEISFCIEPGHAFGKVAIRGKLRKRFDRRTFEALKSAGLVTRKQVNYFGVRWETYLMGTRGWEVFNASCAS